MTEQNTTPVVTKPATAPTRTKIIRTIDYAAAGLVVVFLVGAGVNRFRRGDDTVDQPEN